MNKNYEIKTIEHKGIKVSIKIDYDDGTVSLVENCSNGQFVDKNYKFANRGLEFMKSWINILEAMIFAVKQGQKDLECDLAEKSKFKNKENKK